MIAAAGDVSCNQAGIPGATSCQQQATSDLLMGSNLAGVLILGDLQYDTGTPDGFQTFYDPTWGRLKTITRPALGNHDYGSSAGAGYFSYFGAAAGPAGLGYYSFDTGAWHLISLNSNCGIVGCAVGSPQEAWLEADLAAHRGQCTLAYWHHPHFTSGPHGNDDGGANTTSAFWDALYAAGADVVLSGHDHDYERFAPQTPSGFADPARGIRAFVVGTGGKSHYGFKSVQPNSEVRNADTFGVLQLTLHPSSYDWRFVPIAGQTFADSGTGNCHAVTRYPSRFPFRLRVGRPPRLWLTSAGAMHVYALCSTACTASARGTVQLGGAKITSLRAERDVTPGGYAKLRLIFTRPKARALRQALARNERIRAKVTVLATDAAGRSGAEQLELPLRR